MIGGLVLIALGLAGLAVVRHARSTPDTSASDTAPYCAAFLKAEGTLVAIVRGSVTIREGVSDLMDVQNELERSALADPADAAAIHAVGSAVGHLKTAFARGTNLGKSSEEVTAAISRAPNCLG